jgi:hypothetical protein
LTRDDGDDGERPPERRRSRSTSWLEAGTGPSIVPDRAVATLKWKTGPPDWNPFVEARSKRRGAIGLMSVPSGDTLEVTTPAPAHSGMNIEGGRNALVGLAEISMASCNLGFADVLAFAKKGGPTSSAPASASRRKTTSGGATRERRDDRRRSQQVALRRTSGARRRSQSRASSPDGEAGREFHAKSGANLVATGFLRRRAPQGEPQIGQKRLLAAKRGAVNRQEAVIGGARTRRLPHAIAFGMWFPKTPYPGHEADEKIEVGDLHKGVHVLLEALCDLAGNAPVPNPLD